MATSLSAIPTPLSHAVTLSSKKTRLLGVSNIKIHPIRPRIKHVLCKANQSLTFRVSLHQCPILAHSSLVCASKRSSSDGFLATLEDDEVLLPLQEPKSVKVVLWVLFWASLSLALFAVSGDAEAAVDSIRSSSFGFKIANGLRSLGWPDEAVVFALATLPIIELRGAIPVGYWMQLKPATLTILSILGLVFISSLQLSLPISIRWNLLKV